MYPLHTKIQTFILPKQLVFFRCLSNNIVVFAQKDAVKTLDVIFLQVLNSGIMMKNLWVGMCAIVMLYAIHAVPSCTDKDVCIGNVSNTPNEQFLNSGQAVSPKSIPLDIPSTPRSHRYCVICKRDGSRRIPLACISQTD